MLFRICTIMKAKLRQAIANYTHPHPQTRCAVHVRPSSRRFVDPAQLSPTELEMHVRFYNNFSPLICQMHGFRKCTSFRPKTMVGMQKATLHGRPSDHVIVPYKKHITLQKDNDNGHTWPIMCAWPRE